MQMRSYQSTSLTEGSGILNREWSRHRVSVPRGQDLRLQFSIRSISADMSLSNLAYGVPVTIHPEDRADVLLLQMPSAGTGLASYDWGTSPLDTRHYALIDVRTVSQVHYGPDVDMLVLRIGRRRLMEQLEHALGRRPTREIVFQPGLAMGTPAWDAWAPVAAALQALQRSPLVQFPREMLQAMESMVLSSLLLTQPNNYLDELRQPGRRPAPRHVRLAEEFIHASLCGALHSEDIARHAGVSVRALFDGFREFRDTTPAAYVRQARLAAARAELLRGLDGIAEIAARCGFTHAGRFAAQYRTAYGETPAQTQRLRSRLH